MGLPFILFFAIIIAIIIFSQVFSKKAIVKRRLKKAEFKKIPEFKGNNIAKIVGTVELGDTHLIAPLSGRKCCFYYVHVEEKVSSGKSSRWKSLIEEEVSDKILVKEDSRYAYINDEFIKCYIVQDRNFSSGFWNGASKHLESYLHSHGFSSEGFWGMNKTLRYKEGVIEDGEELAIFGRGVWKDATELDLEDKYGKVLEITAPDGEPVYFSDDTDTTKREVVKKHSTTKKYHAKKRYDRRSKDGYLR